MTFKQHCKFIQDIVIDKLPHVKPGSEEHLRLLKLLEQCEDGLNNKKAKKD